MRVAIPVRFFNYHYDGSAYPGMKKKRKGAANCQTFAYALLKQFGKKVPDFRSSDLWEDTRYTKKVSTPAPLDLVLFNKSKDPYGAHVGVYLGNGKVIHLSKEAGYPTIWDLQEFKKRSRYNVFVGAKRVRTSK